MNGFMSGIAAVALLGVFAAYSGGADEVSGIGALAYAEASKPPQFYRLHGSSGDCTLAKTRDLGNGMASLDLAAQCAGDFPELAFATRWIEPADGLVTLADDNGHALMEFSVADGAAYETFRSGSPILSLTAQD